MRRTVILLAAGLAFFRLSASEPAVKEVTATGIMSVRIHRPEWNLSYPVIKMGGDETLVLHFDEAGNSIETYYYTFTHCSQDWLPSDIFRSEYLDGFTENRIEEYALSFNTTTQYVHYSVNFPNRDIGFKVSGNYIISVYRSGEEENPVITRRFMVTEDIVTVEPQIQRSKLAASWDHGQQVDFTVNTLRASIADPYRSISATILKNGRWEESRSGLKPDFISAESLIFNDMSGKTLFPGGNEYRYFDIKSLRYMSEYIASVNYEGGSYHVILREGESRGSSAYFYQPDLNGRYYVAVQEGRDFEVESDYVYVYFTIPSAFPLRDADLYIYGELTGWRLDDRNRMHYNYDLHRYEGSLLLKQGWYNYLFIAGRDGKIAAEQPFESDHFDTENDYIILVYLRDPMQRYDRLIGWKQASTLPGRP